MRLRKRRSIPRWVHWLVLFAFILLLERFIWPRYSRERGIRFKDVRLVVIPPYGCPHTCELHPDGDRRLLKRLVSALNHGRSGTRWKLALGREIVIHRYRKPSVLIRFDELREDGPILFRDETQSHSGGLYRSRALRSVLDAIYHAEQCRAKPPKIPLQSVSRMVLCASGSQYTLPASSPRVPTILSPLNDYLTMVDTSCHHLTHSEVEPHSYLGGPIGAILTLDPPLRMHTTVMPAIEYREFKTKTLLLWKEPADHGRGIVGFSSDAAPNRVYLFYSYPRAPSTHPSAVERRKRWSALMHAIEKTAAHLSSTSR